MSSMYLSAIAGNLIDEIHKFTNVYSVQIIDLAHSYADNIL